MELSMYQPRNSGAVCDRLVRGGPRADRLGVGRLSSDYGVRALAGRVDSLTASSRPSCLLPAHTVLLLGGAAAGAGLRYEGGVLLRSELDSVELGLRQQGCVLLGSEPDGVEGRGGLCRRADRRGAGVGRGKLQRDPSADNAAAHERCGKQRREGRRGERYAGQVSGSLSS